MGENSELSKNNPANQINPGSEDAWIEKVLAIGKSIVALEQKTPVTLPLRPEELAKQVDLGISPHGTSFAQVLNDLEQVAALTPRTSSKRFYNQLFGGRDPISTAAELVVAFANTSMYTYKAGGINAVIEEQLMAKISGLVGFSDGEGTISPGGSISNLLSVVLARDNALRQDGGPFKIYTSELCHYSIRKNANITGIGRENVRFVKTDDRGRILVDSLVNLIEEDLAQGDTPLMINATAGTTVLGAFDPIRAISEIAKKYSLWLHVDGALGGAMILSKRHRHLIDGISCANSLTWNPHKLMGVPLSCSAFIVHQKGLLEKSLGEEADYLFQSEEEGMADLGATSIQCGRRNDALKLWAAWKHHGDQGFESRVDNLMSLAQETADLIRKDPQLELVAEVASVNVCFRHKSAPAAWICRQLEVRQLALVSHALVADEKIIRLPLVNLDTTLDDIRLFLGFVVQVAADWE